MFNLLLEILPKILLLKKETAVLSKHDMVERFLVL